jgi:hypothetical protein
MGFDPSSGGLGTFYKLQQEAKDTGSVTATYTGTSGFQTATLIALVPPPISGSVALSGGGTLSLTGNPGSLLNLSGAGTLALSGTSARGAPIALSGSGTLALSSRVGARGTRALSGTGALGLIPIITLSGARTLTGEGFLNLVGEKDSVILVTVTGTFLDVMGYPYEGHVRLVPERTFQVSAARERIIMIREQEHVLVNGAFETQLAGTSQDWKWLCYLYPVDQPAHRPFKFAVPASAERVDIADYTIE